MKTVDLNITSSEVTITTSYRSGEVDVTLNNVNVDTEEIAKEIELSTIFEAHGEADIKQFGIDNYGWEFKDE